MPNADALKHTCMRAHTHIRMHAHTHANIMQMSTNIDLE